MMIVHVDAGDVREFKGWVAVISIVVGVLMASVLVTLFYLGRLAWVYFVS